MKHTVLIEASIDGHIAICQFCKERTEKHLSYAEASEWADQHEYNPHANKGPRLSNAMLEKLYRQRSEATKFYTPEECATWLVLADELAERIKTKKDTIEGQLGLFGEEEVGQIHAHPVRNANFD